ncbi:hypothetical protein J6I90_08985 [Pseudidiomarina sp. 1APP75-32.1]|uniref:Uncharacterized protein n=1 Tax=Pseudidiomarina terrestris TaxID=2820060 RepID=A0AAW7QXX0_9GAMM|nr:MULTISPECIES: hypothetical protein [unclassified Pseudidiomarina]MDN7125017.1 hypothetical protein [Pseudidiomarina sp. 1APP75-32.1]MDN7129508.1 hypothetical protein [Pseudidiomarina sp. 1APR75-15]
MQELTDVDYSLRFIDIKKDSVTFLEKGLAEYNCSTKNYFKNPENFVFVLDIDDKCDSSKLKSCVNKVGEGKVDLFVSIFSQLDSDIIELPPLINHLILALKIPVTFSYTISLED